MLYTAGRSGAASTALLKRSRAASIWPRSTSFIALVSNSFDSLGEKTPYEVPFVVQILDFPRIYSGFLTFDQDTKGCGTEVG